MHEDISGKWNTNIMPKQMRQRELMKKETSRQTNASDHKCDSNTYIILAVTISL